ncbi:hypothetical protein F511_17825 [Dorcoceras hygrometricum]|uniref:Reverse transcriptase domain-containing protein n=1 Tax=Dorcoceras hygrometricum TaxID=472368 RepID=A0A2Z7AIJ7_9LAMI|nr:hypothetical protein F511_17825 [Dorcoceras hygrometricum]
MYVESLLVSASINIGLSLLILTTFSVLRRQPSNAPIYFARRLSQRHHVSFHRRFFPWRLLPSVEWISSALRVTEAEILDNCGLDVFVLIRLFKFGINFFMVCAVVGLLVLLPLNYKAGSKGSPKYSMDSFTISNITSGSNWLWVHFSCLYFLSCYGLYLLYKEYNNILHKRIHQLHCMRHAPNQFTVLVREIPICEEHGARDCCVDHFFSKYHPHTYQSYQILYDGRDLERQVKEAISISREIGDLKHQSKSRRIDREIFLSPSSKYDADIKHLKEILQELLHNIRRSQSRDFLQDKDSCLERQLDIQSSGAGFFEKLLTGEDTALYKFNPNIIPRLLHEGDNYKLEALPSLDEIKEVTFSIHADSAAGPDGYSALFYSSCWDIIKEDLFQAVLEFFEGRPLPRSFTATSIVLIPKSDNAQKWSEFRPISLCNVCNKIISKLLATRLRPLLDQIISPQQSGFVKGRQISDNILLAQEMVHNLNYHIRGGNALLKLDMAKAYDRVQWGFLIQVLAAFGFSGKVQQLFLACINNCWFSVNINGSLSGFFCSKRGLRQGDPLSPLLFIIGAEYLSRSLEQLFLQRHKLFYQTGCSVQISHLAYADDILIFSNGSLDCIRRICEVLHNYETTSGQLISGDKSVFITASKTSQRRRANINKLTGFQEGTLPLNYLGAPLFTGHRKSMYFQPLVTKALNKLKGWENKILSPGGRLVLIKSVLLSLPIYLFHVIEPPGTILHRIEMICARFLWGSKEGQHKTHWISWKQICLPKQEGGLDIKLLKDALRSFSVKMWVRFRANDSLWSKFLHYKYCYNIPPAAVDLKVRISPNWRRLIKIRQLAESHICWSIGRGDLSFWYDLWLPSGPLYTLCDIVGPKDRKVAWLIDEGRWNRARLELLIGADLIEQVLQVPISPFMVDRLIWKPSSHGKFSSKSAWELLRHRDLTKDIFTACWSKLLTPTMSLFVWRWIQRKIPTDDVLQSRGVAMGSKCQCCAQEESFDHVFFTSHIAFHVWSHFGNILGIQQATQVFNWRLENLWKLSGHIQECIPFLILWFLWTGRNDSKHRNIKLRSAAVIRHIRYYIFAASSSGLLKLEHWKGCLALAQEFNVRIKGFRRTSIAIIKWTKPPSHWFKLNTDGCRSNQGMISSGGLIRDCSGQVQAAFHGFLGEGSIVKAELTAILQGLRICIQQHLFPIWIETDSEVALHIILSDHTSWDLRHTLTSIQEVRANYATRISHIHREGNAPADYLASLGMQKRNYTVFNSLRFDRTIIGLCNLDMLACPYVRVSRKLFNM